MTDDDLLAALDPDADALEEWQPRFEARIPWERRPRRIPLSVEADSPEGLVEELIRVGVLRGRFSAAMTPTEQWQALRRLWEQLAPRIRERCVRKWCADHPDARIEDLPRLPRRVFLRSGRSLPKIDTWSPDWPPLPVLEGWLDRFWERHVELDRFPGATVTLRHGSTGQFLTALVAAAELRSWGPIRG